MQTGAPAAEYVPSKHITQSEAEMLPVLLLNVPAVQFVQNSVLEEIA